jgi:MFS family permease
VAVAAGSAPTSILLLVAAAAGVAMPLTAGGFSSLVPSLVPGERLHAANALDASSFNAAILAGPALAAALVSVAGTLAAVLAQSLLKIAAVALVLDAPLRREAAASTSVSRSVATGLRRVVSTQALLGVTVVGFMALTGRGILTVGFPFLAAELGAGYSFAGGLWSAFAAGALIGAVLASRIAERIVPTVVTIVCTAATGG